MGVSFRYPDGKRALDRVALTVPAGAHVALVGPSGGRKSTTLRLLNHLREPTTGTVRVFGRALRDMSRGEVARSVGHVGQEAAVFALSVRDNIAVGFKAS